MHIYVVCSCLLQLAECNNAQTDSLGRPSKAAKLPNDVPCHRSLNSHQSMVTALRTVSLYEFCNNNARSSTGYSKEDILHTFNKDYAAVMFPINSFIPYFVKKKKRKRPRLSLSTP